jgi:hypothetical protein
MVEFLLKLSEDIVKNSWIFTCVLLAMTIFALLAALTWGLLDEKRDRRKDNY